MEAKRPKKYPKHNLVPRAFSLVWGWGENEALGTRLPEHMGKLGVSFRNISSDKSDNGTLSTFQRYIEILSSSDIFTPLEPIVFGMTMLLLE